MTARHLNRNRGKERRGSRGRRAGLGTWRALGRRCGRMRWGLAEEHGFTIIEVLAAALILVVGLTTLFQLLITADHSIATTRLRQEETSLAREALEDARGLPYTQITASTIAAGLQGQVPGASLSGSNLVVTRAVGSSPTVNYTFDVSFTACSLDDPSDGYGNHDNAPLSGGSWCSDVAANGTADSNPDDYKRVSVTVVPANRSTPVIQQTILIYQRHANGPAITCLSTSSSCPGSSVTVTSGTSQTFNVTTTQIADRIQWLVNGNPPPSAQVGSGGADPYSPSGTSSTFNWVFPTTVVNGTTYTIDGTYTITAIAYDANGNTGTRSTLQVTVNEHPVLAPTSLNAGWNDLIGGVDVQWVPSVDQDVGSYIVYRQYGNLAPVAVCTVTGTSCADAPEPAFAPLIPAARPSPCTGPNQSYTTTDYYYVKGVDTYGISTWQSPKVDASLCDHQPNAPTLNGTVGSGQVSLTWTAATDPDAWDNPITAYRVYRWPSSRGAQYPGDRYQAVGSSTSYSDSSPDPGGTQQSYCVTAVDSHLNESPCSNVVTG